MGVGYLRLAAVAVWLCACGGSCGPSARPTGDSAVEAAADSAVEAALAEADGGPVGAVDGGRARAIELAEAWIRAQGYTTAPPTVEPSKLQREMTDMIGEDQMIASRAGTLEASARCARGDARETLVAFAYRDPGLQGRGRAVRVAGGEVVEVVHQDLLIDRFCPDAEPPTLAATLADRCRRAQREGTPVLVEFSADWCPDCRRLAKMKLQEPLRGELARWPVAEVDVGRFDQHDQLLEAFGVDRIATWTVLRPTDCDAPVTSWSKLDQRTLEPVSQGGEQADTGALTRWLQRLRQR